MFESKNVNCWSCNNPSKVVMTGYFDTDTKEPFKARFSLDEIKSIKCKVGSWYFIEFNCKPDKEFALPENTIEDNFNITFSSAPDESDSIEYANGALDDYYRVGFKYV